MPGIGLLNEKPLHASLKQWYARPGDRFEVPVDGFVIDIVRDDLLIEIQTGNFSAIKSKLNNLARYYRVRLIYPIVQEKWIVRSAKGNGVGVIRRKSPKRGRLEDLFWELVSIPQLLLNPNFSLEVLMIRQEEVRRYDGKRLHVLKLTAAGTEAVKYKIVKSLGSASRQQRVTAFVQSAMADPLRALLIAPSGEESFQALHSLADEGV